MDQSASRWIHHTIRSKKCGLVCEVDPLRLIHPTGACQVHGQWAVSAALTQAACNDGGALLLQKITPVFDAFTFLQTPAQSHNPPARRYAVKYENHVH